MSKPIHVFMCSCDSKEMEPAEFKKHLSEVHNLKTKEELTGTKQMTSHIDYDKSYSFLYEWTLKGGLKFTEYYKAKRSKEDLMYH